MEGTGKNVLAVLVVITMFISLVGTIAAVMVIAAHGGYGVQVSGKGATGDSGKVSVYLTPPPSEVTGRVAANLVSSGEGG